MSGNPLTVAGAAMALFLQQKRTMFPINPLQVQPFGEPSDATYGQGADKVKAIATDRTKENRRPRD
jgi:hypothetical protein